MDDDYDDFFRQDISEGKDEDEDKDIPSVSLSFSTLQSFCKIWFIVDLRHFGTVEKNTFASTQLWELSASELDTARPEWQPGQARTFLQTN